MVLAIDGKKKVHEEERYHFVFLYECDSFILLLFRIFKYDEDGIYYFAGNEKVDVDIVQQYMQSDPSIDSIEKGKKKVAAKKNI